MTNGKGILHIGRSLFRGIWGTFNVICVLGLVAASYCGYIDPTVCAWSQLPGMTLPVWIPLMIVLLFINLFVMRRMALLNAVALLICSGPILDVCPLNFGSHKMPDDAKSRSFTVLTYNVINFTDQQGDEPDWGNRTLSYILSKNADIVCIQEALPIMGKYKNRRWQQQLDSIHQRYPYYDQSHPNYDMIMSKYPLKVLDIPPHEKWNTGNYSAYLIDIQGRPVTVVNCHLQSIGLTPDDRELKRELTEKESVRTSRKEIAEVKNSLISKLLAAFRNRAVQARDIRNFLDTRQGDIILVGDFNDVPGSYAYRTVRSAGLRDAYADCALGIRNTYNANRFYFHIDQVLYRGNFKAYNIVRDKVRYSDHYPLLTTFVWDNVPPASSGVDGVTGH